MILGPRRARAPRCAHVVPGLLLALLPLAACGSGGTRANDDEPAGIELPVVRTLGRAPNGPATLVVRVDADGRIRLDGAGTMGLTTLGKRLQERAQAPGARDASGHSRLLLRIDADAGVPWVVPLWIQAVASREPLLDQIFLGARGPDGARGAFGWILPRDTTPPPFDPNHSPQILAVHAGLGETSSGDPYALVGVLENARRKGPTREAWVEIHASSADGGALPTGLVAQLVDAALLGDARMLIWRGARFPSVQAPEGDASPRFDPDDVPALLAHVARLKQRPGRPTLRIGDQPLDDVPGATHTPGRGRLATLYGAGVPATEPDLAAAVGEVEVLGVALVEETEEVQQHEDVEDDPAVAPQPKPQATGARMPRRERSDPVLRGLRWLAARQSPVGTWETRGHVAWCHHELVPRAERGESGARDDRDAGSTALALVAFLGAGYTTRGDHPFARAVLLGLELLVAHQDEDGHVGARHGPGHLADHAWGTLALVAADELAVEPSPWREAALRAIVFTRGALAYPTTQGRPPDLTTTALLAMALRVAALVDLDQAKRGKPEPYGIGANFEPWLRGLLGRLPAPTTEVEACALLWLRGAALDGARTPKHNALRAAWMERCGAWEKTPPSDPRAWLFACMGTYELAGETYTFVEKVALEHLIKRQNVGEDPCAGAGSWEPDPTFGPQHGRIGSTVLATICGQVIYRYDRVIGVRR